MTTIPLTQPILLLAPNGQVGFELNRNLAALGQIQTLSREDIDFANIEALKSRIQQINPKAIVNAAAYTAVDKAEDDSDLAYTINATLPAMLAEMAAEMDVWLVHYSTDYVYPGTGSHPWTEDADTAPLSVYGKSKLAGDNHIQEKCEKYLIFRTSWVYAARGHNFMKTMLKLAQSRPDLKVVNDQHGAPTPARLIASTTAFALYRVLLEPSATALSGVYHLAPQGETTWYGFAQEIFAQARTLGIELQLEEAQFKCIATADYPTPASRPANSRLNIDKIETTFQCQMPSWQSQLSLTLKEYVG